MCEFQIRLLPTPGERWCFCLLAAYLGGRVLILGRIPEGEILTLGCCKRRVRAAHKSIFGVIPVGCSWQTPIPYL